MIKQDKVLETAVRHRILQSEYLLPDYMIPGLVRWICYGQRPGGFLSAVLANDLREACRHADSTNKDLLYEYVYVLYNHAPIDCWGSEQNVLEWKGLAYAEVD